MFGAISGDGAVGLVYYPRGDIATADFTASKLASDGAWHELDMSAIIPVDTKLVLIRMSGGTGSTAAWYKLRPINYSYEVSIVKQPILVINIVHEVHALVEVVNQRIEYWFTNRTWGVKQLAIIGWFV